jgi:hypothetical protein
MMLQTKDEIIRHGRDHYDSRYRQFMLASSQRVLLQITALLLVPQAHMLSSTLHTLVFCNISCLLVSCFESSQLSSGAAKLRPGSIVTALSLINMMRWDIAPQNQQLGSPHEESAAMITPYGVCCTSVEVELDIIHSVCRSVICSAVARCFGAVVCRCCRLGMFPYQERRSSAAACYVCLQSCILPQICAAALIFRCR